MTASVACFRCGSTQLVVAVQNGPAGHLGLRYCTCGCCYSVAMPAAIVTQMLDGLAASGGAEIVEL